MDVVAFVRFRGVIVCTNCLPSSYYTVVSPAGTACRRVRNDPVVMLYDSVIDHSNVTSLSPGESVFAEQNRYRY